MKTIRHSVGQQTCFVILDVDPAYYQAARELYYTPSEGGFAKSYPTSTPHLERIYSQFAERAEEMILQMAGARHVPWEQALLAFLDRVAGEPISWWLAGSGALAVRGLDVVPHDLDIITDDVGAQQLGELLLDALVEPVLPSEGWISNWFGRAFLHARIEWVGGVHDNVDRPVPSDFGPTAAARLETVIWEGRTIRVPPLDLQLAVSERRGLADRAEKIRQFLATRGQGTRT